MNEVQSRFDAFLASYAGCDGGNPRADVWVCGIEHGGDLEDPLTAVTPEPEPGAWNDAFKQRHPDYTKWQYNQKVAKVYTTLESAQAATEPSLDGWRAYLASRLYVQKGDSFKLNLFPLACRTVADKAWETAYHGHRFLASKQQYVERCRQVRFPFFAAARRHYKPRVVLGTGKGFSGDFVEAFGFKGAPERETELTDGKAVRKCTVYSEQGSHLVVSPFLGGANGVNRNSHLLQLGLLVSRLIDLRAASER